MAAPKKNSKINRRALIDSAFADLRKSDPNITVDRYSEIGRGIEIETISTGSLSVDAVIGGGFPINKVIDIVGHTSSGKTTLALTCCANLQKKNPEANILYVDAEQAIDINYARSLGVNVDDVYFTFPNSGEEGYKTVETFIKSGVADLVIIDSVAAMIPKATLEADWDRDAQPGLMAKLTTNAIARITKLAYTHECTVILINQWKPVVKVNQYQAVAGAMGNWYQPGGAQLPFYCSQILEIKRTSEMNEAGLPVSAKITMTAKKNKIAPPGRTADFVITYGKGLDQAQELGNLAIKFGLVTKRGSFYEFAPEFGVEGYQQGLRNVGIKLEEDKELFEKVLVQVKEHVNGAVSTSGELQFEDTPEPISSDNDVEDIDAEIDAINKDFL